MTDLLSLIPDPDSLPVAPIWFHILSYLTFYLHLLSAGIMLGLSVQAILGHWQGRTDDKWKTFATTISKILPFSIAFTVNLGVAPLLFLQVLYGNFFYTSSIIMGIPWILLPALLIFAYYAAYGVVFKKGNFVKFKLVLSIFSAAIFAWVAFLLVNINTLMIAPENWRIYFTGKSGGHLNTSESTLFPRYVFYLFILLAIGGIFTALLYKFKHQKEESDVGFHFGSLISGYFSLLGVPAFLLYLFLLPDGIKQNIFNQSTIWTVILVIFCLGLILSGYLNLKRKTIPATIIMAFSLILFVFIRNFIRYLYLAPYKEKFSQLAKNTQYDVMILFFIILVLGLGLIFWITKKTAREIHQY